MVLRHLVFFLVVVPLTAVGFVLSMLTHVLFPRLGVEELVVAAWGRCLLFAAGCRVVVTGRENLGRRGARLVVANHNSFLDPPLLLSYLLPLRVRFVLKEELRRLPLVGWYAWTSGHFFLDRGRARAGKDVVEQAARRARDRGLAAAVFPEGTRSTDGRMRSFKPGSFQIAVLGDLPIQPVAIFGTGAVMPKGSWGPRRGGRVEIRIAPLIEPAGRDRKELAHALEAVIASLGVERL